MYGERMGENAIKVFDIEKAIERLEKRIKDNEDYKTTQVWLTDDVSAVYTALNMLKEKDKEIEKLQENVDYQVLCDFLISSVSDEEIIWTEKHVEELLENFELRWKDAHK